MLVASIAWGHATAQNSIPENGAVLDQSPTELVIQFGGAAKLVSLTITTPTNESVNVDISSATSVDGRVSVEIAPLAPNSYSVSWRAMGLDGHVTSGKFEFSISAPD
jgi:methionine-rich copper-binding protein CopC